MTTLQAIATIISAISVLITSILVPLLKRYIEKVNKINDTIDKVAKIPEKIDKIDEKVDKINDKVDKLEDRIDKLEQGQKQQAITIERMEVNDLKYKIADAFYGYDSIEDIPDEILINASKCCDIYVGEKHLNHDTGAKCKLIYAELERRAAVRAAGKKEGDE